MMGLGHVIGVIEDDVSVRGALRRLFRKVGFEVCLFATAEDYLVDPHRMEIDCLVTDVRLPGMSGLELLEQIRAEIPAGLVAVVITAHNDEQVRARAIGAGASDFFVKPFDNQLLQAAISKALKM